MAYATPTTMIAAFGGKIYQALNVAANADISTHPQLVSACGAASDEADGYLRKRYTLPIATADAALIRHCNSLAFYYLLMDTRPELVGDDTLARRDNAIKFFNDCAKGLITFAFEPENRMETINTVESVGVGSVPHGNNLVSDAPFWAGW